MQVFATILCTAHISCGRGRARWWHAVASHRQFASHLACRLSDAGRSELRCDAPLTAERSLACSLGRIAGARFQYTSAASLVELFLFKGLAVRTWGKLQFKEEDR